MPLVDTFFAAFQVKDLTGDGKPYILLSAGTFSPTTPDQSNLMYLANDGSGGFGAMPVVLRPAS